MTVIFLKQIGETTPLFEGLKVDVLATCYATTREARPANWREGGSCCTKHRADKGLLPASCPPVAHQLHNRLTADATD